jgi:thioredoxin 1
MSVKHIETKEEFEELINGDKPVLVDFSASWCGPCQMFAPILDAFSDPKNYKNADKVVIAKLDIDDLRDVALEHNVMSVPTVIIFKKGEVVGDRIVGMRPMDELAYRMDGALTPDE